MATSQGNAKLNRGKLPRTLVLLGIIWLICISVAVLFCCLKQGYHEDEYYTYYSSQRTYGLLLENDSWMPTEDLRRELVVMPGEGFRYGLVKLVQSWDVHPPVYYWVFHTVCSLTPGIFNKWQGLAVNLIAFGISLLLVWHLSGYFLKRESSKWLRLATVLLYGLTPASMSAVVFIRMYAMLTCFILLAGILHARQMDAETLPLKQFLLPLGICTYLGFLTQYYYFIYIFFLAVGFCFYLLLRDRKLWNVLRYGVTMAIAFGLAILTYPSCLGQMFRGQRGAQATGNFFDLSNTVDRIVYFLELLDRLALGGLAGLLILAIVLFWVWKEYRERKAIAHCVDALEQPVQQMQEEQVQVAKWEQAKKQRQLAWQEQLKQPEAVLLFVFCFSLAGYFFTVSKTALMLGDSSVRYILPVFGILWIVIVAVLQRVCLQGNVTKWGNMVIALVLILVLAGNLYGLLRQQVCFLYPQEKEQVALAKEQEAVPVVYLYDPGQTWCIWDSANELLCHKEVYFSVADETELIQDGKVTEADRLLVYISDREDMTLQIARIQSSNPKLQKYEKLYQDTFCSVYYFASN